MTDARSQVARVLAWEGCHNVRDVGGLPTHDGRATRFGALIRSDMLCRLTDTGQQALFDHGVRTIIDMRTPDEVARDGDAYAWRLEPDARDLLRGGKSRGAEPARSCEQRRRHCAAEVAADGPSVASRI
jgi:hypothetical protein